jgi:hypothetical protein
VINLFKIGIFKKMISSAIGSVLFEGKERPGRNYVPYGMFANIQEDIPSGVLLDQGNEESLLFLPFDIENIEELSKNEIGFGIPSEKNRIYFRNGKITFKIDDTEGGDFAVRYNELEAAYNELNDKYNDLISRFNAWTPIPNDGGAALKTLLSAPPSLTSTGDITPAKVDKIELPGL